MRFLTLDDKWVDCKVKKIDWKAPCLSKFQFRVKSFLKEFWEKSCLVSEEFSLPGVNLRLDLINFDKRVCIECDGLQHDMYCPGFFHKSKEDFINQLTRDQIKERICEINKIRLVRVYETTELTKENFDAIFKPSVL